jgi:hypothetical protein
MRATAHKPATVIPMGKYIAYNRATQDYDFFYDRRYLGSRAKHHDAEQCLNEYVYDMLAHGSTRTATELDSGSNVEGVVADVNWNSAPAACYVCGCAAWEQGQSGPLCPDHFGVEQEWLHPTFTQLIELAVNGPAPIPAPQPAPAPGPHGPEEDTTYGGWRSRDLHAAGLVPAYEPALLAALYWREHARWLLLVAALTPAQLARQAAAHIAYAQQFGASMIGQDQLLNSWRQKIAVHLSQAGSGNDDSVCSVIFELATTDPRALIEFLRGHTEQQRARLAWRYTAWLKRYHGVERLPSFIAGNWQALCEVMPWECSCGWQHGDAGCPARAVDDNAA